MKVAIALLALITIPNKSWCHLVPVGVDRTKVVIWEYWKITDGAGENEMLLYNPMETPIEVVFRKWYQRKPGEPERIYTEEDVLLRINKIKPDRYALFATATSEIRDLHRGLIEVLVNGKSAGLYGMPAEKKYPKTRIKNGIIINQNSNTGNFLEYEIVYEALVFTKHENLRARVVYLQEKFLSSGFVTGEKHNPDGIGLADIAVENLEIRNEEGYDLCFAATGKPGGFEVTLVKPGSPRKILWRGLMHLKDKGTGQASAFNIPNEISFTGKKHYKKRK